MNNFWLAMIVIGLATYGTRLSFILLFGIKEMPPGLKRALRFVPASVLTAIILPEVLAHDGHMDLSPGNARFWAALLASLIAWRTGNVFLTILVGMVALLVLQALLP
jgi:branched-subunit amino acid transport protein